MQTGSGNRSTGSTATHRSRLQINTIFQFSFILHFDMVGCLSYRLRIRATTTNLNNNKQLAYFFVNNT